MPVDSAPIDQHVVLEAGLGIGRYTELGPNFTFESNLEPQVQAHAAGAWQVGDGQIIVGGGATFGSRVAMSAVSGGQVVQNNDFRQEIYELSPRLRWPLSPHVAIDVGYRFTYQRCFFLNVPFNGQSLDAQEDDTIHAGEVGVLWHRDGTSVGAGLGFNEGSAQNDQVPGTTLTASGHNFWLRGEKRWPAGFTLAAAFTTRTENGSAAQMATVQGMQTSVTWPQNTTWALFALAGFTIY